MFYEEWDDRAASLYIGMDCEFQDLLAALPVKRGCIPTVLDYYESADASSLAAKLRSITAFKGIPSPMKQVPGGGTFRISVAGISLKISLTDWQ